MPKPSLTDIEVYLHHETAKALLVSPDGDEKKAVWLAKSQIEWEEKGRGILMITLPIWVAEEKGLV